MRSGGDLAADLRFVGHGLLLRLELPRTALALLVLVIDLPADFAAAQDALPYT